MVSVGFRVPPASAAQPAASCAPAACDACARGEEALHAAETELREALRLNNNVPTAHMYLGISLLTTARNEQTKQYDMAKYAEAQKELETAAASGRAEVALAHKYLGGIYAGNKEYKRAADELELYLKFTPKAPDAD